MMQVNPLNLRSRALLLQLSLQCQIARQQLRSCRYASIATRHQPSKSVPPAPGRPPATPPLSPNPILNPFASDQAAEKNEEDRTPKPLSRPLGLPKPPSPNQNTGIDPRTWRQRRDDFFNYDKHIERRRDLTKQVAKPYFRDWTNLAYAKGKSFLAPSSLIRAAKALYFPNLYGLTLSSRKVSRPTTPLLRGKISIIALFSGTWAERQTATFVSESSNPALTTLLEALSTVPDTAGLVQKVELNIEENPLKAWLIRLFMPRLRRLLSPTQHDKWFLIRRGITAEMREALGVGNGKVGYIYLVDGQCRVRWAGSGRAETGEKEGLVKGVGRLVEEWRGERLKGKEQRVIEGGKAGETAGVAKS